MAVPSSERMDTFFEVVSDEKLLEWEVCLQRLRGDDAKVRMDAASMLRHCVERAVRELSTESFEKFELELHQRVFNLLNEQVSCASAVVSCASAHRVGALQTQCCGIRCALLFPPICCRVRALWHVMRWICVKGQRACTMYNVLSSSSMRPVHLLVQQMRYDIHSYEYIRYDM